MSRLLPGEEGDHTVYVIDFYDRGKYFEYTREPVFYCTVPPTLSVASSQASTTCRRTDCGT